jgi:EmrB/QacA subfamily drug resistance transporter
VSSVPAPLPGLSAGHLDRRERVIVLLICSMAVLLVGLDGTIVNVALPAIHNALHASLSGLQWTVTSYTLVVATLLILSGSTADRIGRRRVFMTGMAIFISGSCICAGAPTTGALIAGRIFQAVGASMLSPVAMSIIRNVFEDPRERAQAIGIWGSVIGLSLALGPIIGGALVVTAGWRWVFLVNLPVGVAALILTRMYVPESRAEHPKRIDPVGQALVIIGLFTLVYAIIEGNSRGWSSPEILGLFAISAICFAVLVPYELHRREPLLEIRFFKSVPFSGATLIAVCAFAIIGGFIFLNTIYLQDARGLSAFHAGLYMLPFAVMTFICAPICGRLVGDRGPRIALLIGGSMLILGPLLLTGLTPTTSVVVLFASYFMMGIGLGFISPPITIIAVAGMPAAQAGVAAAIATMSRQVGQTLGIAMLGAVAGASAGSGLGVSFAESTHPAWWIVVGLGVTVVVLGLVTTTRRALGTAEAVAGRLSPAEAGAS